MSLQVVSKRERERREQVHMYGSGVLLLLQLSLGSRISWAHSLLANLKCKSGNLKHGKRE